MNIRTRLTLRFASIVAIMLLLSSVAIYYFSADYRETNFYERLKNRSENISVLVINSEFVSPELLKKTESDKRAMLPEERISIYKLKYDGLLYSPELIYNTDSLSPIQIDLQLADKTRIKEEVRYREDGFEILGYLTLDRLNNSYLVFAAARDTYGFKKLKNLLTILVMVFIINTILIFIAGWFYSGRALKPISGVVRQVNKITANKLHVRLDEGKENDEISRLAHQFNVMLDRIESAFKVQKNFIANASHELRTPLTAITGQLEVTLMKQRNEEDYKRTIESVLEDIRNLTDISNRLLLLAQTSAENANLEFKPIRMDEIVSQARADLLRNKKDYSVAISIHENIDDEDLLTVKGIDQLMKTAIINLMDNACKYSSDKSVSIKIFTRDSFLHIQFIDCGIGISEEEQKLIFEPFYRAKNAEEIRGHGIGLSLVERIVKLQGGKIELNSVVNHGTTFTLIFPLLK